MKLTEKEYKDLVNSGIFVPGSITTKMFVELLFGRLTELEKVIYGFASDRQSEGSVEAKDRDSKP
jgi:hypothetical protein